jgi:hypothetical protein
MLFHFLIRIREVYRLRCGDYRVFYTFRDPYVSLLKLDRRDDDTYEDDVDAEYLGGFDPEIEMLVEEKQPNWFAPSEAEKKVLSEPITLELLENLRVPEEYHARLLGIKTEDELLDCAGIPAEHMVQILDYMFPPTLTQVLQQPTYTNALKKFSEQLLKQLLDDDVRYVEVKTVDKITHDVLEGAGQPPRIVTEEKLHKLVQRTVKQAKFEGNPLQQQTQRQTIWCGNLAPGKGESSGYLFSERAG